jgi:hypothetical protein
VKLRTFLDHYGLWESLRTPLVESTEPKKTSTLPGIKPRTFRVPGNGAEVGKKSRAASRG